MQKRRRRKGNPAGFVITAVVLVILVVILAWTLKRKSNREELEPPVVQEQTETEVKTEQKKEPSKGSVTVGELSQESSENQDETQAHEASVSEGEKEAQRAAFITDYESAPLLNTTAIKYLTMGMGSSADKRNFNWFSPHSSQGVVEIREVDGDLSWAVGAKTEASATEPGYYHNKAFVSGLKENTTYAYKVGNDAGWSPEYQFTTGNFTGDFTFVVTSDAQIGQSQTEELQTTIDTWDKVVNRLTDYVPESAFLVHLGDQVADFNQPVHYGGFFEHLDLYRTPLVPVVGNHDVDNWNSGGGPWFYERYNVPNRSNIGCNWADTDGDYWFRQGNVLFMVLNSSSVYEKDCHEPFVSQACAANPDVKWKIVMTHHSAYSSVEKYQPLCESYRGTYGYMAAQNDIDLFLCGHDHAYTRTAFMNELAETLDYPYESGSVAENPEGALYVTVGTASGCIYQSMAQNYASVVQVQPETPMALKIDVTDTTLKLTAYLMDSWEIFDEYTIRKD